MNTYLRFVYRVTPGCYPIDTGRSILQQWYPDERGCPTLYGGIWADVPFSEETPEMPETSVRQTAQMGLRSLAAKPPEDRAPAEGDGL